MEDKRELFNTTSQLLLYNLDNPNELAVHEITGHREMGKEELIKLGYPTQKPRKSYMTFNIQPLDMDATPLSNQHLIEKLLDRLKELNPKRDKGTPVFIEP